MSWSSRVLFLPLVVCLAAAPAQAQYRLDSFRRVTAFRRTPSRRVLLFYTVGRDRVDLFTSPTSRAPAADADLTEYVGPSGAVRRRGPAAINYIAPAFFEADRVQFCYKLEGENGRWVDAGTRRTVHYSHLAPGGTFHVLASGGSKRRSAVSPSASPTRPPNSPPRTRASLSWRRPTR